MVADHTMNTKEGPVCQLVCARYCLTTSTPLVLVDVYCCWSNACLGFFFSFSLSRDPETGIPYHRSPTRPFICHNTPYNSCLLVAFSRHAANNFLLGALL